MKYFALALLCSWIGQALELISDHRKIPRPSFTKARADSIAAFKEGKASLSALQYH